MDRQPSDIHSILAGLNTHVSALVADVEALKTKLDTALTTGDASSTACSSSPAATTAPPPANSVDASDHRVASIKARLRSLVNEEVQHESSA